ncbi:hypothetical protein IGJ74_000843 [Enterococcus sp. AZ009]
MERYKILRVNDVFDKPYLFFESTPSIYLKKAELEYIFSKVFGYGKFKICDVFKEDLPPKNFQYRSRYIIFIDNNNNKISIFYYFINWVF